MKAYATVGFAALLSCATPSMAFDSGSSGSDGALTPNVDTLVTLPPSGILNYTSINIPVGVTVRFSRNGVNTPATLLVSGNATIAGSIDVGGEGAPDSNGAGNGNIADDGLPGRGGPGGFPGGSGGKAEAIPANARVAQAGIGPGGGRPSPTTAANCFGGGGSFGDRGAASGCGSQQSDAYGNPDLLPMVGGSGGAGGNAHLSTGGGGGGGGGGGLLLAVTGTLQITGSIVANGGVGGRVGNNHSDGGTPGGGGSGGAIRLVATSLGGNGAISATGGRAGSWGNSSNSNFGAVGRIRLEAETFTRTAATTPPFTQSAPGALVVVGVPTIRIASVAGQAAPAEPTGNGDIVLPADAPNPVPVGLATTQVPLGTTISVIVSPPHGAPTTSISSGLQGTVAQATATASITLPDGPSVLLATLSFSTTAAQQQALSNYTDGEPVVSVELAASASGAQHTILITASGRRVAL